MFSLAKSFSGHRRQALRPGPVACRLVPRAAVGLCLVLLVYCTAAAVAGDWTTKPSTYSHDPATGQRVHQFAPKAPSIAYNPYRVQSGYRHVRSSIQAGGSAEHLHVVEQWGQEPVRPYGEWRFPLRPYSAPYPYWGPPVGYGFGGRFPFGGGGAGVADPFDPYAPRAYPDGEVRTRARPYDDGRYPSHRRGDDPTRRFEPVRPRGYFDRGEF